MSRARICHYRSPVMYFCPISAGLLDLLLHLLNVRNPKEVFWPPGIGKCQKYTFVLLVFELSPLKIALKPPFFAPSSRFLETLRWIKPYHVIYQSKENFERISEIKVRSFWNEVRKNDKLFTVFLGGADELFAICYLCGKTLCLNKFWKCVLPYNRAAFPI